MDRPLRLPQQDRADFETVLSRALAGAPVQAALREIGDEAHGVERLRRSARDNAEYVLAAAAPEYERYAALRADADAVARLPVDASGRERASGWLGVLAVIVPIVAGAAAAIFLLLGYAFGLADDLEVPGQALVGAGWIAAGVALVSALAGGLGLLGTASRSRAAESGDTGGVGELAPAREAWRTALAERGMVPYLVAQASAGRGGATATPGSHV
ncbi:hypothetical protein KV557_01565 [Kitasatospora aureofaciens]|uniref:hypothetical protein n=1 Tax=Kitasatospora aureofaciens TaxID=1894 RepID=UPI001C447576|nr:hypothetical protein [Kitasatospora aureofaciens]MBV6695811.1 hypothetical protein [Kitasatospora aureofaciens]